LRVKPACIGSKPALVFCSVVNITVQGCQSPAMPSLWGLAELEAVSFFNTNMSSAQVAAFFSGLVPKLHYVDLRYNRFTVLDEAWFAGATDGTVCT
jgi:hypothetical protein